MTSDLYFVDEAENDIGRCLVLKAPWSDDFIDIINKENISVLRLTESMGWSDKDISFLEKLQDVGLRGVEVYAWAVKDITPLRFIPNLEYLGIQCEFTKAPDFSNLSKLKICKLLWRPQAKTLFSCSGLRLLNIMNYSAEDFQPLMSMTELRRLQITSRKLVSLSGIEHLQSLKVIDLAGCTKLESLTGVEKCNQLQVIELENCKKINDISCLGELTDLKEVVLTDCGKVKSLQPLAKCKLLESLTFTGDTNIEDGDFSSLLDMPKLSLMWFVDKRHYSHKQDQVKRLLS